MWQFLCDLNAILEMTARREPTLARHKDTSVAYGVVDCILTDLSLIGLAYLSVAILIGESSHAYMAPIACATVMGLVLSEFCRRKAKRRFLHEKQ